jgi:hypothetical protein
MGVLGQQLPSRRRGAPAGRRRVAGRRRAGFSEAAQVLMLRHGLGFAFEVVRLVRELPGFVAVRCIIGANDSNGTFRFHRARAGDVWIGPDLDGFELEQLVTVERDPPASAERRGDVRSRGRRHFFPSPTSRRPCWSAACNGETVLECRRRCSAGLVNGQE